MADTLTYLDKKQENVCQMFADSIGRNVLHFWGFFMTDLIKLAKTAVVTNEADRSYSIRIIW